MKCHNIRCHHTYFEYKDEEGCYIDTEEGFYVHPVDMIQEGPSGWKTLLYGCPKCGTVFVRGMYEF